jgi:hypothetical protein
MSQDAEKGNRVEELEDQFLWDYLPLYIDSILYEDSCPISDDVTGAFYDFPWR